MGLTTLPARRRFAVERIALNHAIVELETPGGGPVAAGVVRGLFPNYKTLRARRAWRST